MALSLRLNYCGFEFLNTNTHVYIYEGVATSILNNIFFKTYGGKKEDLSDLTSRYLVL